MTENHPYLLSPSPTEVSRYRLMAAGARRQEEPDWVAAGVVRGARVADVGCGPAAVAVTLADVVGPTGRVDAVDRDPDALALAAQVVADAEAVNVQLSIGTATSTGLDEASYDLVMMRHVLAHNGGSEQAVVDHLVSLARPGGGVYVVDVEAEAIRIRPKVPEIAELDDRYVELHRSLGNDLSVGLRLGELLRAAGLSEVHHRGWYTILELPPGGRPPSLAAFGAMKDAGLASDDDLARWEAAFERLDAAETRPTIFVPTFAAWGRRPG